MEKFVEMVSKGLDSMKIGVFQDRRISLCFDGKVSKRIKSSF